MTSVNVLHQGDTASIALRLLPSSWAWNNMRVCDLLQHGKRSGLLFLADRCGKPPDEVDTGPEGLVRQNSFRHSGQHDQCRLPSAQCRIRHLRPRGGPLPGRCAYLQSRCGAGHLSGADTCGNSGRGAGELVRATRGGTRRRARGSARLGREEGGGAAPELWAGGPRGGKNRSVRAARRSAGTGDGRAARRGKGRRHVLVRPAGGGGGAAAGGHAVRSSAGPRLCAALQAARRPWLGYVALRGSAAASSTAFTREASSSRAPGGNAPAKGTTGTN